MPYISRRFNKDFLSKKSSKGFIFNEPVKDRDLDSTEKN